MSEPSTKFSLTPMQEAAARERAQDLIVTAGAGSGKTSTLVARYISLLEDGISPNQIAAITFTKKAAREMRNRVRSELRKRLEEGTGPSESHHWEELEAGIDAARIGTIHSLCSEILRAHPAEAVVDPGFSVIDEGISATLKVKAVEDGLNWAVGQPQMRPLFDCFRANGLQVRGEFILNKRLDASQFLDGLHQAHLALHTALEKFLTQEDVMGCLECLRSLDEGGKLASDAGDALAEQVLELLRCFNLSSTALSREDVTTAAAMLFTARRQYILLNKGRQESSAKTALVELRDLYDQSLGKWLGGKVKADAPPDTEVEQLVERINPLMAAFFKQIQSYYRASLAERSSLDFDDLEEGALRLLALPPVAARWQNDLLALLVDEFQDTNQRQRLIIQGLRGEATDKLFVVGDARQSIYRFRGADVTVFRNMQTEITQKGGRAIDLDLTFRAHKGLLDATGDLLQPAMGIDADPHRPYLVPYTTLTASRPLPRGGILPPYIELILGTGDDAAGGRTIAARALASRLLALQGEGQVTSWDDVTLLFRAASGFGDYEVAFEAMGIPFPTVAGSGFFDRPEVRDLLNILRALADPWDDLAMAGLLRSPAFGLSDAALYKLRWHGNQFQPLRLSLKSGQGDLDEADRERAQRADIILDNLEPWVDRLPVVDLMQRVINETDYRAVLASAPSRLWRNLDKLLSDARKSRLVQVRAFMEYLEVLRDVGAREGEAPAEAEGAVRLMTIHKAKGLEFNIVVLADAARQPPRGSSAAYLLPETGLTFRLDKIDSTPLAHRLAAWYEKDQDDAERRRILYVALTRAKEKLLISGHITQKNGSYSGNGWLGELCDAAAIDLDQAVLNAAKWQELPLSGGGRAGLWISKDEEGANAPETKEVPDWPTSQAPPLFNLLRTTPPQLHPDDQDFSPDGIEEYSQELGSQWRATSTGTLAPPEMVVGTMVHRAIQRWCFPGNVQYESLMNKEALQSGLVNADQRGKALSQAAMLLSRFRSHPLWQEMDTALERYHELPYTRNPGEDASLQNESGDIDMLYRSADGFVLVDFKTDSLHNFSMLQERISRYLPQLRRYIAAVEQLLGVTPKGMLCFINDQGKVTLIHDSPDTR